MQLLATGFDDLHLIKPTIFGDSRGYFYESFNEQKFLNLTNLAITFVQDNQSLSKKGVLRGLHFQNPPVSQDKLVRVIRGSVLDVVLDLRKDKATFGQHYAVELNEENHLQLFVPKGFAHGFLTLQDDTVFSYKCSNYYFPKDEGCIRWNDTDLNIDWNFTEPTTSEKDDKGMLFKDFISPF